MDQNSTDKYHLIAQQRAEQFKTTRQQSHCIRARSQDGQPVAYKKVKERANITRQSRAMSDPEIPGTLVILNAKGLFQGKNGNLNRQSNPESNTASVDIMDTDINRPLFFDPSLRSKEANVSDLKKKFEAVQSDITGDKHGITESDFLNPLHKVNQDLDNSDKTSKRTVKKKLEKTLNNNTPTTTKPTSALTVNEIQTHSITAKKTELKSEMPTRPPPRAFVRDPLKRLRGESDPMPLDENRWSRVHVFPPESLREEVQEESSQQLVSETEIVVSADGYMYDGAENDDDNEDFNSDEWDSDFDDDDDEDEDEQQKRDSQSSHGSSCDAEPLVSNNYFNFTLTFLMFT